MFPKFANEKNRHLKILRFVDDFQERIKRKKKEDKETHRWARVPRRSSWPFRAPRSCSFRRVSDWPSPRSACWRSRGPPSRLESPSFCFRWKTRYPINVTHALGSRSLLNAIHPCYGERGKESRWNDIATKVRRMGLFSKYFYLFPRFRTVLQISIIYVLACHSGCCGFPAFVNLENGSKC